MLNTTIAGYSLVSKQNYSCWRESASSILPNEPPQQLWPPGAQLRAFPLIHALTAVPLALVGEGQLLRDRSVGWPGYVVVFVMRRSKRG